MFTGLIQALGTARPLGGDRFEIALLPESSPDLWQDLALGDSVAVDGVCLTVEAISSGSFTAYASGETLSRTTLGQRSRNAANVAACVNIETAARVGSKLGGHFVTGHVDGIGCLEKSVQVGNSWVMYFTAAEPFALLWQQQIGRYILPKGSIAVNGISLTIADCDPRGSWFNAAVIPHTYNATNLCYLPAGNWVNIESDILGKYVAKLLGVREAFPERNGAPATASVPEITPAFLSEHGY